jgi:hypothetical protein
MISTVQTPLPIFAETAPNTWPHFCAPSPASETISTVCSWSRWTTGSMRAGDGVSTASAEVVKDMVAHTSRVVAKARGQVPESGARTSAPTVMHSIEAGCDATDRYGKAVR